MASSTISSQRPLTLLSNKAHKQEVSPEIREARKQLLKGLRQARIEGKHAYIALPAKLIVDGKVETEIDINSLKNFESNPLDISVRDLVPDNEPDKKDETDTAKVEKEDVSKKPKSKMAAMAARFQNDAVEEKKPVKKRRVKKATVSTNENGNDQVTPANVSSESVHMEISVNEKSAKEPSPMKEVVLEFSVPNTSEEIKKAMEEVNGVEEIGTTIVSSVFSTNDIITDPLIIESKIEVCDFPMDDSQGVQNVNTAENPIIESIKEASDSPVENVQAEQNVNTSENPIIESTIEVSVAQSVELSNPIIESTIEVSVAQPVELSNPIVESTIEDSVAQSVELSNPIIESTIEVSEAQSVELSNPSNEIVKTIEIPVEINVDDINLSEKPLSTDISLEMSDAIIEPSEENSMIIKNIEQNVDDGSKILTSEINDAELIPSELTVTEELSSNIDVVKTLESQPIEIEIIPSEQGVTSLNDLEAEIKSEFTNQVEAMYESDKPADSDIQAILDSELEDIPEESDELIVEELNAPITEEDLLVTNGDVISDLIEDELLSTEEEPSNQAPEEDSNVIVEQPEPAIVALEEVLEEEEPKPKPPPYDPVLEALKFCGELPFDIIGFFIIIFVGGYYASENFGMFNFWCLMAGVAVTPVLIKSVLDGIADM